MGFFLLSILLHLVDLFISNEFNYFFSRIFAIRKKYSNYGNIDINNKESYRNGKTQYTISKLLDKHKYNLYSKINDFLLQYYKEKT